MIICIFSWQWDNCGRHVCLLDRAYRDDEYMTPVCLPAETPEALGCVERGGEWVLLEEGET